MDILYNICLDWCNNWLYQMPENTSLADFRLQQKYKWIACLTQRKYNGTINFWTSYTRALADQLINIALFLIRNVLTLSSSLKIKTYLIYWSQSNAQGLKKSRNRIEISARSIKGDCFVIEKKYHYYSNVQSL